MKEQRYLAAAEAALIEEENNLRKGTIAADRPATDAEQIYLDKVDAYPLLAFHALGAGNQTALYVIRPDPLLSEEEFLKKSQDLLSVCRSRTRPSPDGEPLSLCLTNWGIGHEISGPMSISMNPDYIRGIWTRAPRRYLLLPIFTVVPPTEYEERSPGRCMSSLNVSQIHYVDHLMIIGATSFRQYSIWDLVKLKTPSMKSS